MNIKKLVIVLPMLLLIVGCQEDKKAEDQTTTSKEEPAMTFTNKGHELVYNMVQKVGDYQKLRSKKDVVYTYTYTVPDGKTDISTEKYIFDGELSYGEYKQHQRTLPELKGTMEQGYDGNDYWIKADGKTINDTTALKRVKFSRPTNFYWFTMFQKLLDGDVNYDYLGEKKLSNGNFDVVKVTFDSKNDKKTDIYQLYINKQTGLVDQFLFTVADFGVMDEPFLMQLDYEEIDGLTIPSSRKYKKSTWDAKVTDAPWIMVNWTNIKFDNNLKEDLFSI